MPQTREHLAILDLLRIPGGVVALTKIDLIDDPDWLELVQADVSEALQGTVLDGAPIIPVSARTGQGLAELTAALQEVLARTPPRLDRGRPRLWIDRVFTIGGFGTVVTGTLVDGHLEVGQEVEILPRGLRARIRGLQTHKTRIQRAVPGSRVAINLTGISKQDLARGDLVTTPGWLRPTTLTDVRLDLLRDAPFPLKHNAFVKFFCGSAETVARVRLLGTETLAPGESGWVQLELDDPLPLVRGDRFIIRVPSPAVTVGGGEVVDPEPRAETPAVPPRGAGPVGDAGPGHPRRSAPADAGAARPADRPGPAGGLRPGRGRSRGAGGTLLHRRRGGPGRRPGTGAGPAGRLPVVVVGHDGPDAGRTGRLPRPLPAPARDEPGGVAQRAAAGPPGLQRPAGPRRPPTA
jgi:hypothetical protein